MSPSTLHWSGVVSDGAGASPAGPGIAVTLPEGTKPVVAVDLPALDVSALAGAYVTSYAGVVSDAAVVVRGACVRGPADRWAPGAEQLVFEQATKMVARLMPANVHRLDGGRIEQRSLHWTQTVDGRGDDAGRAVHLRGVHVLGFAGEEPDVVVCSVACQEPMGGQACEAVLESRTVSEGFVAEPPPGLLARAVVGIAEHPTLAAALGAILAIGITALVLHRRPRPRGW